MDANSAHLETKKDYKDAVIQYLTKQRKMMMDIIFSEVKEGDPNNVFQVVLYPVEIPVRGDGANVTVVAQAMISYKSWYDCELGDYVSDEHFMHAVLKKPQDETITLSKPLLADFDENVPLGSPFPETRYSYVTFTKQWVRSEESEMVYWRATNIKDAE